MTIRQIMLILAAAVMAGCESLQSRIKKNQASFDAFPPEVQSAVQEGRVGVGFTPEQVVMALGKPDRVYTKKTTVSDQEIWAYGVAGGSSVGFGLGMSNLSLGSGGGSAFGSSVGVSSAVADPKARMRIAFENGKVASVERREK